MKFIKIFLMILIALCFANFVQAANVVTIDGISKDGLTISITTQATPPPPIIPPIIPPSVDPPVTPPTPPVYTKLNQIVPLSGDFYGVRADNYSEGQVKKYTLPLGEVYPGKNLRKLYVTTIARMDGQGDVDIKLTSPDGSWSMVSASAFADEGVTVASQKWPQQPNYPADYLDSGYWTLEITGKTQASNIQIWWKCFY